MVKKTTKAELILRHIASHPRGLTLREIQKFIWDLNYPSTPFDPKTNRGYYCTNLTGYGYSGTCALLDSFCLKNDDGRWQVCEPIIAPFYRRKHLNETRVFGINKALRLRQNLLFVSAAPKCYRPSCNGYDSMYDYKNGEARIYPFRTPDEKGHFVMHGRTWKKDCLDRIWTNGGFYDNNLTDLSFKEINKIEDDTRKLGWTTENKDRAMRSVVEGRMVCTTSS